MQARFKAGDPLRALAALAVVFTHVAPFALFTGTGIGISDPDQQVYDGFGAVGMLANAGAAGVLVFFALSGFLITRPFVAAAAGDAPLPSLRRYARNRAVRIVPAFWVAVVFAVVLTGDAVSWRPGDVLAMGAFGQVYGENPAAILIAPAWSLDVEMVFYLAVPVIAWLVVRSERSRAAVGVLVLFAVVSLLQHAVDREVRTPELWMWGFLPGIGLAVLEPRWRWRPSAALTRGAFVLGAALLLVSGIVVVHPAYGVKVLVEAGTAAGAGLVVGACLAEQWTRARAWRVLDNRPLRWLGARSYPLFLVHWIVLHWVMLHVGLTSSPWANLAILLPAATLASVLVADVMHRCVERPAMRLRVRRRGPAQQPFSLSITAPSERT
jgi:peptidoglycan/LPS O-acetylase OafA/YrhL